jgi:hypothetical protein
VYAWVGSQRSHGVVTKRIRADVVRRLHHQRRDLHQSTYLILSEDWESSYYQVVSDFGFPMRCTGVYFTFFQFSYRDPPKKPKKIHIFRCPITRRAANFVLVTLLSLCPSLLSLVPG